MKSALYSVLPFVLLASAQASAEFRLALGPSLSSPVFSKISGQPVSTDPVDYSAPWNFDQSQYSGFADVGQLGVSVSASVTGSSQFSGDNTHAGAAIAHFRFDDLIFRNVANPNEGGFVAASANFDLSGSFAFTGDVKDRPELNRANLRVRDFSAYGVLTETGFYGLSIDPDLGASTSGIFNGLLRSESFEGTFSTPLRRFAVGVPQVFGLELSIAAQANTSAAEFRTSTADFLHTLNLRPGEPVFNLPDDYTVNSIDGRIRNNIFWPTPSPVPPVNRVPDSPISSTLVIVGTLAWLIRGARPHRAVSPPGQAS